MIFLVEDESGQDFYPDFDSVGLEEFEYRACRRANNTYGWTPTGPIMSYVKFYSAEDLPKAQVNPFVAAANKIAIAHKEALDFLDKTESENFLDHKEAADFLNVSIEYLNKLIIKQELQVAAKLGEHTLFSIQDLTTLRVKQEKVMEQALAEMHEIGEELGMDF